MLASLTGLIFIHELGHYIAAKSIGIRVRTFSVGLGPSLLNWTDRTGTKWSLGLLPIGGYVQLTDREDFQTNKVTKKGKFFSSCSFVEKIFVTLAGPIANIFFSVFLMFCIGFYGPLKISPVISDPNKGTVAKNIGLVDGDKILQFNGRAIYNFKDLEVALIEQSFFDRKNTLVFERNYNVKKIEFKYPASLENFSKAEFLKKIGLSSKISGYKVHDIKNNSVAEKIGLKKNDLILSINGAELDSTSSFSQMFSSQIIHSIVIKRKDIKSYTTSKIITIAEIKMDSDKNLGVFLKPVFSYTERRMFFESIVFAFDETFKLLSEVVNILLNFFKQPSSYQFLEGLLKTADSSSITNGDSYYGYLAIVALISISVGVINLLPIPSLDGGNFVIFVIEKIRNKPFSYIVLSLVQRIGILLIITATLYLFFVDLSNFIK
jgi:regulator of sigma E protease